jgi:hypothetical protein
VDETIEKPVTDVERDVLALMLSANAELLAGRLTARTSTEHGAGTAPVLSAMAAARSLASLLDDIVATLVGQARAQGFSWAAIGEVLQVSRQAAFQRFGPRTAEATTADGTALADAPQRATTALRQFLAGELQALRAGFDETMAEKGTVALLGSVRSEIAKKLGPLREVGEPSVSSRLGYTVVDGPLIFKKGTRKGRVVFAADARIAGFFVLTEHVP